MEKAALSPARVGSRSTSLAILYPGRCEPLKAAVHGAALGLAALMSAYNAAAWLRRRQPHLAINAVIYIAAVLWEQQHVKHHIVRCPAVEPGVPGAISPDSADRQEAA